MATLWEGRENMGLDRGVGVQQFVPEPNPLIEPGLEVVEEIGVHGAAIRGQTRRGGHRPVFCRTCGRKQQESDGGEQAYDKEDRDVDINAGSFFHRSSPLRSGNR